MSSSSPSSSRYGKTDSSSDQPAPSRVGLSSYTTQRLAELRARRAELESEGKVSSTASEVKPTPYSANGSSSVAASIPPASSGSSSSSSQDAFRSQRSASLASENTDSVPPAKPAVSMYRSEIRESRETNKTSEVLASNNTNNSTYSESKFKSSASSLASKEDDDEYVGFANLPEQVHRKAIKRGFDFTVMVVGESGLGKSTLVGGLFLNPDLYKNRQVVSVEERINKSLTIEKKNMEMEERGIKLRLTIVDTPGFNDSINCEDCWKTVEDYINQQFDQYFRDENGLNRKNIKDNRVHCCLYFVSPYGHGLRQIDVEFMRRMHDKVNIIPIIAKADTLTQAEVKRLKTRVMEQIRQHKIDIYQFPECDDEEDDEFKRQNEELKAAIPFSVVGSNATVEVNGKKVRGRVYPWGIVEVDNPNHCDFLKLRQMLISTHMQDLKDVTRDVHYENFRARYITEKLRRDQRERNKLKRDSVNIANFDLASSTDQLLQQKDDEIRRMQEMLAKMQAKLGGGKDNLNGLENL